MKSFTILFVFLFSFTKVFSAETELKKASDVIKSGTQLFYTVNFYGSSYEFIVKVKSINMNKEIDFDYELMSSYPKKANVIIQQEALENAQTMYNYFDGKDLKLNTSFTVFVSKHVFKAINRQTLNESEAASAKYGAAIKPKTAWIQLDWKDEYTVQFSDNDSNPFFEDKTGKYALKEIKGKDSHKDREHTIRFMNDADCPLITYMDLGWTIELNKIVN